jgi:ADP-heptose:LPS heptosyltransferase
VVDLGGMLDLAELAHLVAACEVLVSGNTGPAHLAAAVGTPIVSVFAPVVPRSQWLPWSSQVAVLGEDDIACEGCRARECPFPGQPCLASVDGTALLRAVHRCIELAPSPVGDQARRVAGEEAMA